MTNAELKFLETVPTLLRQIAENTRRIADALGQRGLEGERK